jgi:hypothetical protein
MKMATIGIDLAKTVFQIHGVDDYGKPVVRSNCSPSHGCKHEELSQAATGGRAAKRAANALRNPRTAFAASQTGANAAASLGSLEGAVASGISLLFEPRYHLVCDTEVAAVQIGSRPNESTHCSVRRLRHAPTASNAELNVALGRITAFTLASSAL